VNYTFTIISPKHGTFEVIAPLRFKAEIERYRWFVLKCKHRAPGRQFAVMTHATRGMNSKTLYLHILIWSLAGKPPTPQIDHKDGQPLNNAEDNLRAATPTQNQAHRQRRRNNTSGVIGVHWHADTAKWVAGMSVNYKHVHLGLFANIDDAREARDAAVRRLHGEFAVTNTEENRAD
jgi:hypothetical protein